MDLAKLISMLDHGGLYFSILALMEDELEGAPPETSRIPDRR
jgi:hypothetical protein